ncbi:MAG: HAMP domain-containing sensor histidine kinase, partial [Oscillospiraceae bacterium]
MKCSDFSVFDDFPEPIFGQKGGSVVYCNQAASAAFGGLKPGDAVPPVLAGLTPGSALTVELDGGPFAATAVGEGEVLVLRPIGRVDLPLAALSQQLRKHTGNLMASAGLLVPTVERSQQKNAVRYLATMNQSLYRILRMIDELEQAQEQPGSFAPAATDLAGFCHYLALGIEPLAAAAGVTFSYESDCDCLITTGDEKLLRRMILSLVSNAIKAAGSGGQVSLALGHSDKKNAVLTVKDSGTGLNLAQLSAYFSGEHQGPPAPGDGLGLGIPIVRSIAKRHGGTVMAESREGAGLTVAVALPIRPPKGTTLRTAPDNFDTTGGFSPLLVELSDALPWQVFLPR